MSKQRPMSVGFITCPNNCEAPITYVSAEDQQPNGYFGNWICSACGSTCHDPRNAGSREEAKAA